MTDKEDMLNYLKLLNSPLPSKNKLENWLVHYTKNDYQKHNEFGGKWLIFCDDKTVDKTWDKIKKLQDKNLLGNISKVSTNLNADRYNNSYVICIYTYNSNDKEDVLRVRESLSKNGFNTPLKYKRDIETINRVYGSDNEFLLTI